MANDKRSGWPQKKQKVVEQTNSIKIDRLVVWNIY